MLSPSLLLFLAFPAQADQEPAPEGVAPAPQQIPSPLERIAAIVGTTEITLGDVRAEVNRLVPVTFFHARLPEEKKVETYQQALANLIERALIHQDAVARKMGVSTAEIHREFRSTLDKAGPQYKDISEEEFDELLVGYREKVVRRILIDKNEARFEMTIPKVTEEKLQALYEKLQDQLLTPLEAHFLHILLKVDPSAARDEAMVIRAKVEDIISRLEAGEEFQALAKELSEDIYAANGGDMGFIRNGSFQVSELNEAAFALADQETSGILTSLYGFHLLRRVESKPQNQLSFQEAEQDLRQQLSVELRAHHRETWLAGIEKAIGVEEVIRLDAPETFADSESF